jgi:hypothetical protein
MMWLRPLERDALSDAPKTWKMDASEPRHYFLARSRQREHLKIDNHSIRSPDSRFELTLVPCNQIGTVSALNISPGRTIPHRLVSRREGSIQYLWDETGERVFLRLPTFPPVPGGRWAPFFYMAIRLSTAQVIGLQVRGWPQQPPN